MRGFFGLLVLICSIFAKKGKDAPKDGAAPPEGGDAPPAEGGENPKP